MNMDRDRETDINFDFLRGVIMGASLRVVTELFICSFHSETSSK